MLLQKIFFFILLIILCSASIAETIRLPSPKLSGAMSLDEAIYRRRAERSFFTNALTKSQISQLLWACQGTTDGQWGFRAVPSAGALYPLEIYVLNNNGTYHYSPEMHQLELLAKNDKRPNLSRAALAQVFIEEAPMVMLITANFQKSQAKFGQRSERYVHMEAGHAAQNVLLEAVALGLGAVPIGSFWDDVVSATLNLPPDNEPLYIIPIGYIKR